MFVSESVCVFFFLHKHSQLNVCHADPDYNDTGRNTHTHNETHCTAQSVVIETQASAGNSSLVSGLRARWKASYIRYKMSRFFSPHYEAEQLDTRFAFP